MLRTLSFIFILIFAVSMSAQSPALVRIFDDGTRSANAGEFEKALKSYRTALMIAGNEQIDDDYLAKLYFNLGVCLYRSNKAKQAVPEFSAAIKLRKGNYHRAYYALGMAESEQKNWTKARTAFQEAILINTSDGEAWFDLGVAYLGENDRVHAEAAFCNSIRFGTRDASTSHNNIGVLMALRDEFSSAVNEFETALTLSGGRLAEARANLVYCRTHERELKLLASKLEFGIRHAEIY